MSDHLKTILDLIAAAAGLGTAAMGLVDACKVFGGGVSNFGFGYIKQELAPFLKEKPGNDPPAFGRKEILLTLRANWINGMAKADQKAKAKSLIHLYLTRGNAGLLAAAADVSGRVLEDIVANPATTQGAQLSAEQLQQEKARQQQQISVLGQFDAVLSAVLDAAYELADQKYRNASKACAMVVSTILAVLGGWAILQDPQGHLSCAQFFKLLAIGIAATPLAPIAKDLASSLQASAAAVRAAKL